jgi:voltage-gated potassium channel Kch
VDNDDDRRASVRPRPVRRLLHALTSPDSYGSILVLLLVTYALSVSLSGPWQGSIVLLVQIAAVWLALRVSRARRSVRVFSNVVLALAGLVAVFAVIEGESEGISVIVFATSSLLYLIAPASILRSLVLNREVDLETVLGAIDAYLLVGMFFAYIYLALGAIDPPFFQGGIDGTVAQSLFFSFTTLTTTGYGNLVPASSPGQTVAVLEMLTGQLFLVTAVAKVINVWRPRRLRTADITDETAPPREGDGDR